MAQRSRSKSTVLTGLVFASFLGASAYFAFDSRNVLAGSMFAILGVLVLAATLRRPPAGGPSLRVNVLWTGLGFMVAGVALLALAVIDDSPNRVLAGLGGVLFLGLGIFACLVVRRLRRLDEQAAESPRLS